MKYIIQKTDGTPVDPQAIYFVLRIDKPDFQGRLNRSLVHQYAEAMIRECPEAGKAAMEAAKSGWAMAMARAVGDAILGPQAASGAGELNNQV